MKQDTGAESPRSMSLTIYYRGYSIMLTQRDPDLKLKPLLDNAIELIDIIEGKEHFEPSWNLQDNEKRRQTGKTPVSPSTDWMNAPIKPAIVSTPPAGGLTCLTCGSPAVEKSGISKTSGRPWRGIFCETNDKTHTKWQKAF